MTTISKNISPLKAALDSLMEHTSFNPITVVKKEAALDHFLQTGIPSMKHEDWKYTYLQKVLNKGFVSGYVQPGHATAEILQALPDISSGNNNRIVLIDGHFNAALSYLNKNNGLTIEPMSEIMSSGTSDDVYKQGTLANSEKHALTALNLAMCQDGVYLKAAMGSIASLEIFYVVTDNSPFIRQPYNLIILEEGSKLTIHEHQILSGTSGMQNMVSEVFIADHASLNWVKIQDPGNGAYFFDTTYVQQGHQSTYKTTTLSLTGALLRNNQYIFLEGTEADADLQGLYLLDEEEQADNLIIIHHQVPSCTSNQLYKGVLDGHSTGVFNGKIIVAQDAQKTIAFQSNKNILVSETAAAYFRPQLEIFADDVKCSHGATAAEIENSELFYLQARGIGKAMAKSLLMMAFATEVVEHISDPEIRQLVNEKIESKLKLTT